jgi:hypothetical protein
MTNNGEESQYDLLLSASWLDSAHNICLESDPEMESNQHDEAFRESTTFILLALANGWTI